MPHRRPVWILPAIVTGQVAVTSTWFAANAIVKDIATQWPSGQGIGAVTLAVQLGFIAGTLLAALSGIADRVSGRRLFFLSSLGAALSNLAVLWVADNLYWVMACRFLTGMTLAGVYPVGMRIAASWYAEGLGRALGYLVGALVLGTSSTYLMRALQFGSQWQSVIVASTLLAVLGGGLVCLVPDGPHLRRNAGQSLNMFEMFDALRDPAFRSAALGYFGHMWELYAFWAFMPLWVSSLKLSPSASSLVCFAIIAMGAIGCAVGGVLGQRFGSRPVAGACLLTSGLCCLMSPLVFGAGPTIVIVFLLVWGVAVVTDSPQLSSLNAQTAPRHLVGSALTGTTCIGFSITVLSLFWLEAISTHYSLRFLFITLAFGPFLGLWYLRFNAPKSTAGLT